MLRFSMDEVWQLLREGIELNNPELRDADLEITIDPAGRIGELVISIGDSAVVQRYDVQQFWDILRHSLELVHGRKMRDLDMAFEASGRDQDAKLLGLMVAERGESLYQTKPPTKFKPTEISGSDAVVEKLPTTSNDSEHDARQEATFAIDRMAAALVENPPDGISQGQISDFINRYRSGLAEQLQGMILQLRNRRAVEPPRFGESEPSSESTDGQPGGTRKTPSGATEQDVFNYYLRVQGIWGKNRKEKSELVPLAKYIERSKPKELAELLPKMRERLNEMRVKPGARVELQEHKVTLTKYPDSRYVVESSLLGTHRLLYREVLSGPAPKESGQGLRSGRSS